MILFLRIVQYATYPFLALSMLLWMGAGHGGAFISDFTVINRTRESLRVTPVGVVGLANDRWPLPLYMLDFPALPSIHKGEFKIAPGESVDIRYSMDDINFSELQIEDEQGRLLQLVTDPKPMENQYHGPVQQEFTIDDLAKLEVATPAVKRAAERAKTPRTGAMIVLSLMFGPWLVCGLVIWLRKRLEGRSILHPSGMKVLIA